MKELSLKLFTLDALEEKKKQVESYDGFGAKEMINNFIENNHYNPIEEHNKLSYELYNELFPKELKDELYELILLNKNNKIDFNYKIDFLKRLTEQFPSSTILEVQSRSFIINHINTLI